MNKLPEKELLLPDEAARYFTVNRKTIYRWVESGKLKAVKLSKATIRITRESVINLKEAIKNCDI